jgi:hypothetical protein
MEEESVVGVGVWTAMGARHRTPERSSSKLSGIREGWQARTKRLAASGVANIATPMPPRLGLVVLAIPPISLAKSMARMKAPDCRGAEAAAASWMMHCP